MKDFAPVMLVGYAPMAITTGAIKPYKNFADVLAAAKAKPDTVTIGNVGNGSLAHLVIAASTCATAQAAGVPTEAGSPWPSMRHDRRNTGAARFAGATTAGDRPWSFRTAKGVFSTPVVGADETVYAGSADTWFYAHRPRREAPLALQDRRDHRLGRRARPGGTVTFGSGDEHIYRLRTDRGR